MGLMASSYIETERTPTPMRMLNFQDMQYIINQSERFLLINTLPINEQQCILPKTIRPEVEVEYINELLKLKKTSQAIVVYGKNCNDPSVIPKQQQLHSLGFQMVFVYFGGMFEWLLLQDIYSENLFPTTSKEKDILKFLASKQLPCNNALSKALSSEITFI